MYSYSYIFNWIDRSNAWMHLFTYFIVMFPCNFFIHSLRTRISFSVKVIRTEEGQIKKHTYKKHQDDDNFKNIRSKAVILVIYTCFTCHHISLNYHFNFQTWCINERLTLSNGVKNECGFANNKWCKWTNSY